MGFSPFSKESCYISYAYGSGGLHVVFPVIEHAAVLGLSGVAQPPSPMRAFVPSTEELVQLDFCSLPS